MEKERLMTEIVYGVYALFGVALIIGAFKGIDWLIALKYRTKDDCEICQKAMRLEAQGNRDLLIALNTKVDLMLKHSKITLEE